MKSRLIVLVCTGLAIHGLLTWILVEELQKTRAMEEARKKLWEDCKRTLNQMIEDNKIRERFWEQMRADFPEEFMDS